MAEEVYLLHDKNSDPHWFNERLVQPVACYADAWLNAPQNLHIHMQHSIKLRQT